ncbi:DUF397 domain-containing protein [Streptomyces yaanensis]|uniref:DUF397 domain-containing protein n=1 Tax=Streptomyces yaanensis TaxID=1142239 RepID=A0ABV7SD11_9ACTN|nr:DUF397 domain-containing protein [Streptomyces sp. CGMCC 4.7035]WNB96806.1 DUF397 domain-containing protein [Streptomyces sp. CGMCC 4.7035]
MTGNGTLRWFKSSYSDGGGNCVEVAYEAFHGYVGALRIRDSKNPTGPHLTVSPGAWGAFLKGTRTP